jgi:hypothetical protein
MMAAAFALYSGGIDMMALRGRRMTAGPKILGIIVAVIMVMLAALFALSDEWTNCNLHNWSKGYHGVPDFPPGIVVSGSAGVKTIDFRRTEGVVEVCIVRMPYLAEPNFTPSMVDRGFRPGPPWACWRDAKGQIVVAGRSKDMPLMWKQIDMGNPLRYYITGEKQCANIENAVLACRNEICAFPQ